ncbi:hypothetical protein [Streptomyces kebangsaanensis]|uniref:hypothetical protein n=1 Tax=Streptomyces kebangsaanensis TaxID=864058 RepID=UPI000939E193|nr:hypothetical protein [Streptomyces kebangsaanensis]
MPKKLVGQVRMDDRTDDELPGGEAYADGAVEAGAGEFSAGGEAVPVGQGRAADAAQAGTFVAVRAGLGEVRPGLPQAVAVDSDRFGCGRP